MKEHWTLDPATTFLNHGSYGATPKVVLAEQRALRDRMERDPCRFFNQDLEGLLDEARVVIARFIEAEPADLALVTNATHAANAVLASIPLRAGDEILVTNHGYAAVTNAARRWAERAGATVRVAEIPFPILGPAQVLEAVAAALTPATRLAILDHVTSPSALVFPIRELVSTCEARGVDVFVDAAHAPAMVPFSVRAIGAAYATGNLHKWVCAPKGAAFLHVRNDKRAHIRPLVTSHGASAQRTDRSRFHLEFDWTGTADPTALLSVPHAIDFLRSLDARPDAMLEAHMAANHALALEAQALLCGVLDLEPPAPAEMLGSMAAFPVPDRFLPDAGAWALADQLYARHRIQLPVFPWSGCGGRGTLRVSAQRYNTQQDYEKLGAALRAM